MSMIGTQGLSGAVYRASAPLGSQPPADSRQTIASQLEAMDRMLAELDQAIAGLEQRLEPVRHRQAEGAGISIGGRDVDAGTVMGRLDMQQERVLFLIRRLSQLEGSIAL